MDRAERFQKNLKRWALTCPEGAEKVVETSCEFLEFCQSISGTENLKVQDHMSGHFFLHSEKDPIQETNEWFSELFLKNIDVLYIYGVGLGYFYEKARSWLREAPNRSLVFFEDNPAVIHRLFEMEVGEHLIGDRQVALYLFDESQTSFNTLNEISLLYAKYSYTLSALPSYASKFEKKYNSLKNNLNFFTNMNKLALLEHSNHGLTVFRNYFYNYLHIHESYLAPCLINQFKNIPAIICGAGPSLDKNIDVLAELSDRALLFAGGTALNALNAKGVIPHFGIGIDPNPDQFTRLIMNNAYEIPFFYRSRMLYEALKMVHGDKLFVPGSTGYGIGKWIEESLGIAHEDIEEGFNVLNFSLALAHAMGCNPIICVGIDLAYSQGKSYASGVISHPIHDRKGNFRTKQIEDDLISKIDINGIPVFTLWKWIAESIWYSLFSQKHPEVVLINATEGGIGFSNIVNMPLNEVKKQLLIKQYDFSTRIHGEIQNSMMPHEATAASIRELLLTFSKSLSACSEHIEKVISLLIGRGAEEEKKEEIDEIKQLLSKEIAYQKMLKTFEDSILRMNLLEENRLRLDESEGRAPKEEIFKKKNILQIKLYNSIKTTALINSALIQEVLREDEAFNTKTKETSQVEENKEKSGPDNEHMTVSKTLEEFQQSFEPSHLESVRETYPSGNLKLDYYLQNQMLHGPSTFYHANGQILAHAWFIEGKQEGEMRKYFSSGILHSLQSFHNGRLNGIQKYFYPDGALKSVFSYTEGKLDGDVRLYFSNGKLSRKLHFKDGKRFGIEQIWYENGQIQIEADYFADLPVNTARSWYLNGVLAREITYDAESKRSFFKQWNPQGLLVSAEEEQLDYFDQMALETKKLTLNLDTVFEKIGDVLPLIKNTNLNSEKIPNQSLQDEIEQLKHEFNHLHGLSEQITQHIDLEPHEEALWKNPLSRQEMEQQFNHLSQQMNHDLLKLEKEINNFFKTINKPKPEDKIKG